MAIFDDVVEVIERTLKDVDPAAVNMETSFERDLGADSLDLVELIMELEEAYDFTIPDEDAQKITTVGAAVRYIEENTGD